jgi:integrase
LTTAEVAERYRTSPATVRYWRYAGTGPQCFIRRGRWEGLKPPEVFYPEIHPLDPEAVKALIVTASPRYRALVRQAAATGLPQGELFGLEDDEPAETVTVKQQLIGPDRGVPWGGAIRRGSWAKVWARNIKRANAYLAKSGSKVRVPEGTTLHDLRHFCASVLIKNGATPQQVQMRLGHAKRAPDLSSWCSGMFL